MQHYLGCAIGFNSDIIQNEDWQKLSNISNIEEYIHLNPTSDTFSFTIIPHTEDSFDIISSQGWSTIVLKDISKISMVKTINFDKLKEFQDIYFPLNKKNQDEILKILSNFHIKKYIHQVKLIVYSYCC